jgi:hypothetical protein
MIGPVVVVTLLVFSPRFTRYDGRGHTKALFWMVPFGKAQRSAEERGVQLTDVASGGVHVDSVIDHRWNMEPLNFVFLW